MSGGDAHIVTGMDAIVNSDNVRPGIDLKELERKMINGGIIQQKSKDPADRFNDELKAAADKLGIPFGELNGQAPRSKLPAYNLDATPTRMRDSPMRGSPMRDSPMRGSPMRGTPMTSSSPYDRKEYEQDGVNYDRHDDYDRDDNHDDYGRDDNRDDDHRDDHDHGDYREEPNDHQSFARHDSERYGGDLIHRTMEQERRSHIDSVMGTDTSLTYSLEKEKREDMKSAMLAEIDSLMTSLEDEAISLERIPNVNQKSSYEEVESVLRMLRHKNDHTRYCTFAEEFMLFGAYALEDLFDGKRTYYGYRPDLVGWHNHVNVKIKRMRHDTGQLVSGVMHDYNIGPGARVLLELIPNMVLYSKMKKQQHSMPGLFSEEDTDMQNAAEQATANIRSLSE
jgi:hypothetical protein